MSVSEAWTVPPATKPIMEGTLQKTSGPLQRYSSRLVELHPGFLYLYRPEDPGHHPYSRISLEGVTLANTGDSASGFALTSRDESREGKVKFITESTGAKNLWLRCIHQEISSNTSTVITASKIRRATARRASALVEGFLQKRQGAFGSYHSRWCELRANEGLSYSKYKSSPDESFKHVPIYGAKLNVNLSKLRIQLTFADKNEHDMFLKCQSDDEFNHWVAAFQAELGLDHHDDAGTHAPPTSMVLAAGLKNGEIDDGDDDEADHVDIELSDLDSDDEIDLEFDDDIEEDLDEAFELADLASPEPIRNPSYEERFSCSAQPDEGGDGRAVSPGPLFARLSTEPHYSRSPPPRGYGSGAQHHMQPVFLESVSIEYAPVRSTKDYDKTDIEPCLHKLEYNLSQKLQRFYDRLHIPLRQPYSAVYEHINLLDLDAKLFRALLTKLLENFGQEEAAREVVCDLDAMLRLYKVARKRFLLYREMAEFREQQFKCGLKLGVNGTMHFIDQLTRRSREAPTKENIETVEKAVSQLEAAVEEFRMLFDVYEESIESLHELETSLSKAYNWLGIHSRL